jgi:hypothetical protein
MRSRHAQHAGSSLPTFSAYVLHVRVLLVCLCLHFWLYGGPGHCPGCAGFKRICLRSAASFDEVRTKQAAEIVSHANDASTLLKMNATCKSLSAPLLDLVKRAFVDFPRVIASSLAPPARAKNEFAKRSQGVDVKRLRTRTRRTGT